MRIGEKRASIFYKSLLALAGAVGIALQVGLFSGQLDFHSFRMFTILSNLACLIYTLCEVVWLARLPKGGPRATLCPMLKGACLLSISLTGVVAAVLLRGWINFTSVRGISMFLLHVVVPLMFLADWLLFDEKGVWTKRAPLWWVIPPYVYFAYIMISAQFMPAGSEWRFPYPFLNYEVLGLPVMVGILAGMTLIFVAWGSAYWHIDRAMSRRAG